MTGRYASIDIIKAVAIVMVIWIHAFLGWGRQPTVVAAMTFLTGMAVPAFFFASGFLTYGPAAMTGVQLGQRLRRLLIPYFIASLLVMAYRRWVGHDVLGLRDVLFALATGSAWGLYFYIPMVAGAVVLGAGLSRVRWLAWPLFAAFFVVGFLSKALFIPIGVRFLDLPGVFWAFRNPLMWWGYFLAGWVVAQHYGALAALPPRVRLWIGWGALTLLAAAFAYNAAKLLPPWNRPGAMLAYVSVYVAMIGIVLVAFDARERSAIRWLSEATYPIYLYHLFFIELTRMAVTGSTQNQIAFAVALIASLAFVHLVRLGFGNYARLVIG